MTPDPTAVRTAADYRRDYLKDHQPSKVSWQTQGDSILADAYLALTDPAPLTVERLVEMGFGITDGPRRAVRSPLSCNLACLDWIITHPGSTRSHDVYPSPRTVGELTQLLTRMGK